MSDINKSNGKSIEKNGFIFDNIRNIDYPAIIGYPANYRLYREY